MTVLAGVSLVACVGVLLFAGPQLVWIASVTVGCLLYQRFVQGRR